MRGSRSGRPIMALLDLLGRRWALRVIWELREPAASFRELQDRCDSVSSSVLSERLAELRDAGAIRQASRGGYELTREGKRLLESMEPLERWARRWESRSRRGR